MIKSIKRLYSLIKLQKVVPSFIIILEFSGLSQYSYKDFSQMNDKIVSKKGNLYMMKKTKKKGKSIELKYLDGLFKFN